MRQGPVRPRMASWGFATASSVRSENATRRTAVWLFSSRKHGNVRSPASIFRTGGSGVRLKALGAWSRETAGIPPKPVHSIAKGFMPVCSSVAGSRCRRCLSAGRRTCSRMKAIAGRRHGGLRRAMPGLFRLARDRRRHVAQRRVAGAPVGPEPALRRDCARARASPRTCRRPLRQARSARARWRRWAPNVGRRRRRTRLEQPAHARVAKIVEAEIVDPVPFAVASEGRPDGLRPGRQDQFSRLRRCRDDRKPLFGQVAPQGVAELSSATRLVAKRDHPVAHPQVVSAQTDNLAKAAAGAIAKTIAIPFCASSPRRTSRQRGRERRSWPAASSRSGLHQQAPGLRGRGSARQGRGSSRSGPPRRLRRAEKGVSSRNHE